LSNASSPFERYQAPSLHEAGHAVIAVILGRKLCQLSRLTDEHGDGHLNRDVRDDTAQEILEEVAISLAGEEGPFVYNEAWATDPAHDMATIARLAQNCAIHLDCELLERVRQCVKVALQQLKDALYEVASQLSASAGGVISGAMAEEIIRARLAKNTLRECLSKLLK
jgi:hypothetical protein